MDTSDPSLGQSLLEDIRKLLQAKVASAENEKPEELVAAYQANVCDDNIEQQAGGEDDSDWTDDDTLDGEEDLSCQSVGRNWEDCQTDNENKENVGSGRMLEFSPPEKLPADPPSHLIWQIFGRETEMRRKEQEQEREKAQINKSNPVRKNSAPKPAPLSAVSGLRMLTSQTKDLVLIM